MDDTFEPGDGGVEVALAEDFEGVLVLARRVVVGPVFAADALPNRTRLVVDIGKRMING